MLEWLLRYGGGRVSLLPRSFVDHVVREDILAEIGTTERLPLPPIGLLMPAIDRGEAAEQLISFLRRMHPYSGDDSERNASRLAPAKRAR